MAIAARTSSDEITAQVATRFVGKAAEGRLINAAAVDYTPGVTDDTTFLAAEVPIGTGGYARQPISFKQADLTAYNDAGVGIATKATVFSQDGSTTSIDFSHVTIVWTTNAVVDAAVLSPPSAGNNGTYTNIPVTTTSGTGSGLVIDLIISNNGASGSDYQFVIKSPGKDYTVTDVISIPESELASLGAVEPGAGDLSYLVDEVYDNPDAGKIIAVAKTTAPVQLSGGNQAVFYWNIKLYQISSGLA